MKIKNVSKKIIGNGAFRLLPGETMEVSGKELWVKRYMDTGKLKEEAEAEEKVETASETAEESETAAAVKETAASTAAKTATATVKAKTTTTAKTSK